MSRIDKTLYEAQLLIAAHPAKGIWAADMKLGSKPARWFAGNISTNASAHSLFSVAIIAALRPLSHRTLMELSKSAKRFGLRPRLEIVTNNPSFSEALEAAMKGQNTPAKHLKTGKNFLITLAGQLARWEFTLTVEPESKYIYSLGNWAAKSVLDPTIPLTFTPAVIAELR
jgi:hypothetical protein